MTDQPVLHAALAIDGFGRCETTAERAFVSRICRNLFFTVTAFVLLLSAAATAQQQNPVYVDNSPRAWSLLQQAQQQTAGNPGQAARVYQELLDDYAMKLIPLSATATEHFVSVRRRVLRSLRENDGLLERYRQIEAARAEQMLKDGRVQRVAITRSLTPAGLEALLHLAQRDLESARFEASLTWLNEARRHPDLQTDHTIHIAFMAGLAAQYRGNESAYQSAVERLEQSGDRAHVFLTKLKSLAERLEAPGPPRGTSLLNRTQTSALDELVGQEIWSYELTESLFRRTFDSTQQQLSGEQVAGEPARRVGAYNAAAATVFEGKVFINEGHRVLCLDRFTGREIWSHRTDPINDHHAAVPQDLNIIAVEGQWLVTLNGHGYADERSFNGGVLCLDSRTGTLRWSRNLDRLGGQETYDDLYPHGAPIIHEGAVYVLARKVTQQQLTASYVVSFDLQTGALRWVRFLSSVGGLRRSNRRIASPTIADGDLYVANEAGAVARLDADTGEIKWLQQIEVAVHPLSETTLPYEFPAPVLADGNVAALRRGANEVLVLNRERGDRVQAIATNGGTDWHDPRYLLANDRRVFAVSRNRIAAFDMGNLSNAIWRFPPEAQSQIDQPAPSDDERFGDADGNIMITGRVQVVQQALIVPTHEGVLIIDEETGLLRNQLQDLPAGNPLAVDAQLLLASADRLDAFMSFEHAEQMLKERIAAKPDEPGPAISLLQLARKVDDFELAMTAAQFALSALDEMTDRARRASYRDQFLEILLDASRSAFVTSTSQGERLFAMVQSAARTPRQRVAYLLAYGAWLEASHLDRAVEAYQKILADDELAQSRFYANDLTIPAAVAATRRLGALIEEHGEQAYAAQADFARLRFDQMREQAAPHDAGAPPATAEQFAHLARTYPFAQAATDAALEAAKAHVASGNRRAALAVLMDLYRAVPSARHAEHLLGLYSAWCNDLGWTQRAANVLAHVQRAHGNISLVHERNARRRVNDWLQQLRAQTNDTTRVQLGEQKGPAQRIAATLVPALDDRSRSRISAGLALLHNDSELIMVDADRLEPRWTVPLAGPNPRVLELSDQHVLLWYAQVPNESPYVVSLDAQTGEQLWRTPALESHVDQANRARQTDTPTPNNDGPDVESLNASDVLPLIRDRQVILVRGNGDVVAFRRDRPNEPQWSRERLLAGVHVAQLHDGHLLLAGVRRSGARSGGNDREPAPGIVIIDPQRGEVRHRLRLRADVRWLAVGPLGTLACGTHAGIETFNLHSGEPSWTFTANEAIDARRAWTLHDSLIIADQNGALHALSLSDPRATGLAGPFDQLRSFDEQSDDLVAVRIVNDSAYALYTGRLVRYDDSGRVLGADAISTRSASTYDQVLFGSDQIVLLRYASEQGRNPERPGFQTEYRYVIDVLSNSCRALDNGVTIGPFDEQISHARVINGWVLVSPGRETIAVPFPPAVD